MNIIRKNQISAGRADQLDKFYAFLVEEYDLTEFVAGEQITTYKYDSSGKRELYENNRGVVSKFLKMHNDNLVKSYGRKDDTMKVDKEMKRQLESLGYI